MHSNKFFYYLHGIQIKHKRGRLEEFKIIQNNLNIEEEI